MEISGTIRTNCAPEVLVATLSDARAIDRLLPEGAKVEAAGEGRFGFTVSKTFGPIKLTLPGQMTLTQGEGPHDRRLVVRAAHVIGGKVDLDLVLKIEPLGEATRLSWSGALEATGLAGRVAREHRGRIGTVVKGGFTRLKHIAEARAREGA